MSSALVERNRASLADIVRRVRIFHGSAYIFDGREFVLDRQARDPSAQPPVVQSLADRIYAEVYTHAPMVSTAVVFVDDQALQQRFLDELVKANSSRWSWTADFRVVDLQEGSYRLEGGDREVVVPIHMVDGPDRHGRGRLRTDKGSATVQPAWYWAYGEDNIPANAPNVVRVYWNLSPEAAIPLLRVLTRGLNEQRVPFQFKLLQDPQRYGRPDSAVLYLPGYAWRRASPVVAVVHDGLSRYMRDATPTFARRLGRGLALAEDPRLASASFGTHRSRLAAEALWAASEAGAVSDEERLAFVEEHLTKRGYPLARLHLEPQTLADYEYPEKMVAVARGA